jgi:hypothetical protein
LLQHPAIGHPAHDLPGYRDVFVPLSRPGADGREIADLEIAVVSFFYTASKNLGYQEASAFLNQ